MTLRELLLEALSLKSLPRAGWVRAGVEAPESVAAHSWGVAWLVLALCPPELDRGRALALAILHDLAEVRVGDLTPRDRVPKERKLVLERQALQDMLGALPQGPELLALARESIQPSSPEGCFVQACDKLDMALQASWYEARQPLDLAEFLDSALAQLTRPDLRLLASGAREPREVSPGPASGDPNFS